MKENPQLEAIATLVGTVIGAGVLGMPFLISQAGLLNGLILIFVLGAAVTLMYLLYGEVILRTGKRHQLIGYAEKYLGKYGKLVATLSFLVSMYGSIIAYLLSSGTTLSAIFGGASIYYMAGFLLIGVFLVRKGIQAVERSEVILMFVVLGLIILISALCVGRIDPRNLTGFNIKTLLLPYGIILFALMGTNALPEMRSELEKNPKLFRRSIIIGMAIPIIVYALFSVVVVGVVGLDGFLRLEGNSRMATIALIPYLGARMAVIGNLFALFAITTSYLSVGLSLKDMFSLDFGINDTISLLVTFAPPALLVMLNIVSFISVLNTMGIIVGGITAFLIVLMYWRAKTLGDRKPEYDLGRNPLIGILILLVVIIGTLYELLH